jgi:hypothetical protein
VAPVVLAMVLGNMIEISFRRSLILSDGSISIFFLTAVALLILGLAAVSIGYQVLRDLRRNPVSPTSGRINIGTPKSRAMKTHGAFRMLTFAFSVGLVLAGGLATAADAAAGSCKPYHRAEFVNRRLTTDVLARQVAQYAREVPGPAHGRRQQTAAAAASCSRASSPSLRMATPSPL